MLITRGVFTADPSPLREAALNPAPYISNGEPPQALQGSPGRIAKTMSTMSERSGLAVGNLAEPFTTEEYLEYGWALGELHAEKAPQVQDRVLKTYILDLTSSEDSNAKTDRQPFSQAPLLAHTESSAEPVERQPGFITLMCLDPGNLEFAQTLVVPMRGVLSRLSEDDRATLRLLRYDRDGAGTILRSTGKADVLAFRDFGSAPLAWRADRPLGAQATHATLQRLTEAIYAAPRTTVRWNRGLLVLIDNTKAFHARTVGAGSPQARNRHLQRLRGGIK